MEGGVSPELQGGSSDRAFAASGVKASTLTPFASRQNCQLALLFMPIMTTPSCSGQWNRSMSTCLSPSTSFSQPSSAGAEAAVFGEVLEAQILSTLLQQQIHVVLWLGCTPALDAPIMHLRHRNISVTTANPLPEHVSFAPGGVHLITPYAELPAQMERHSVDLVRFTADTEIWPLAACCCMRAWQTSACSRA